MSGLTRHATICVTDRTEKLFICPGETHPISRSVHLSRLAAFYPRCRDCALRHETGQLAQQTLVRIHSTERRIERKSLLTDEGLRGVYLNEINRRKAEQAAAALAGLLWEERPLVARTPSPTAPDMPKSRSASPRPACSAGGSSTALPLVVVGHDERPCSPDLMTGVVRSLRRMSCRVVDIGLATKPAFWFAVDHLKAAAGIFVTGSGRDPAWTGFDFVGPQTTPLSRTVGCAAGNGRPGFDLRCLEEGMTGFTRRPTRQAGPYRLFRASIPYEASLWKHFHALRPLVVCCGVASRLVRGTLERLFATLPCRLVLSDLPARARNVLSQDDPDAARLAASVRRTRAHVGVLIDDDAQRTAFLDESGRLIPPATITLLVARLLLAEQPGGTIVLDPASLPLLSEPLTRVGGQVLAAGPGFSATSAAMRQSSALLAGGDGPLWFAETFPTSDAILTLARVLDVLSQSDAACSAVADAAGVEISEVR
jgi:phosphomannomutase